jgi:shikimate kinase
VSADAMNLYLVGFMGCGKSEVGRRLAEKLGWGFEDTDVVVEAVEGRAIERIFAESGEARFREVERNVLEELSEREHLVVATGGGLFLNASNRSRIRRTGASVWLDASPESIRERLGAGDGRPLWSREDPIAMRALLERRRAAYALADVRVDASTSDPSAVASLALERIEAVLR